MLILPTWSWSPAVTASTASLWVLWADLGPSNIRRTPARENEDRLCSLPIEPSDRRAISQLASTGWYRTGHHGSIGAFIHGEP